MLGYSGKERKAKVGKEKRRGGTLKKKNTDGFKVMSKRLEQALG